MAQDADGRFWQDPRDAAENGDCAHVFPTFPRGRHVPAVPLPRRSLYSRSASANWKWLYLGFYALSFIALMVRRVNPSNLLFFPLCFSFAWLLYRYLYKSKVKREEIDENIIRRDDMLRGFHHGFWSGSGMALVLETLLSMLIYIALSRKRTNWDDATRNSVWLHVFLFLEAFLVAGFVEEWVKYYVVKHSLFLYIDHPRFLNLAGDNVDLRSSIIGLGISVGLGFGTCEAILYVCFYSMGINAGSTILVQFMLWLMRMIIGVPFHSCLGFMWGITMMEHWYSLQNCAPENLNRESIGQWLRKAYPMIVFHGVFDFIELEWFVLIPRLSWITDLSAIIVAFVLLILVYYYSKYHYRWTMDRITHVAVPDDDDEDENGNDDDIVGPRV